jgi:uncharacterized protein
MNDFDRGYARSIPASLDMSVDAGLRSFMLGVYNKLALGLIVSAALAFLTGTYAPVRDLLFVQGDALHRPGFTIIGLVVALAPLGVILFGFSARSRTVNGSGLMYWAIVSLMGASLGILALRYTGVSIFSTFLITSASFGALSLVGYTTKKDLTGMGNFLFMALFGLIVASIASIFIPGMSLIVSLAGVLIFAGLIAYDTQRLKLMYYQLGGDETSSAVATNVGALELYLDFINLFQFLLSIFGSRR